MMNRHYTKQDQALIKFTELKNILAGKIKTSKRPSPATHLAEPELSIKDRRQIAGLMRVNHTGEVCAQALYDSQAAISRDSQTKQLMRSAAMEEYDHLHWCQQRLSELNSHVSALNPLWYLGSWGIGALAALAGNQWNLGFVAETEQQVTLHLAKHLTKVPTYDTKTHAILSQMQLDETEHANTAIHAGAHTLPTWIKKIMARVSKVMTTVAYYV